MIKKDQYLTLLKENVKEKFNKWRVCSSYKESLGYWEDVVRQAESSGVNLTKEPYKEEYEEAKRKIEDLKRKIKENNC